jgi:hypothetical protein
MTAPSSARSRGARRTLHFAWPCRGILKKPCLQRTARSAAACPICGLTFELRRPARHDALGPRRTMEPATALRGPRAACLVGSPLERGVRPQPCRSEPCLPDLGPAPRLPKQGYLTSKGGTAPLPPLQAELGALGAWPVAHLGANGQEPGDAPAASSCRSAARPAREVNRAGARRRNDRSSCR